MMTADSMVRLLVGCSALALASPAAAQDGTSRARTPSGSEAPDASGPAPQGSESASGSDIVVTGSRVITNGNNSPSPVTVVSTAQLQQVTPSNIPDALNRLPVFAGSSNQSTFGNGSSNATGNYLNLRAVGAARTLVLFDGHRFPPTTQDGLIDANMIPQLLLQRVDVVTGGASAVYGSDAITGVVNFVVDKKFVGLKLNAQAGLSGRGDNGSMRYGAAFGRDLFGGRGHFEASVEYYDSDGIDTKLTRPWNARFRTTQGAGTAANPYHIVENSRLATYSSVGLIKSGPFADMVFGGPNNTLRPFVHGGASGTTGIEIGGDGIIYNSSLQATLKTFQTFARFDYDMSDAIKFYVQGSYTSSQNSYSKEENVLNGVTISAQNAFLQPQYRAAMAAAGVNTFTFSREETEIPRLTPAAEMSNYFVVAGLNGDLGSNLSWDVAYSHSRARQKSYTRYNTNLGRLAASLDAVTDPTGKIVCSVTLTNPGLYPGCVPMNPFGANTITDDVQDYILQDTYFVLRNTMDDFTGSISGSLFDTWAGPVKMALSGEYRHLSLDLTSTAQPLARTPCTGLRFNCNANTALYSSNVVADAHDRNQRITEGAFEVDVPLLADSAIAKSLNLNAAVRYTHYDTSGNATTWKVGLDWHLTDDFTLRGTRSRDIRAPNLNDLFAPVAINPAGFSDKHTNTSGNVPIQSQGNPDLVPEVANTLTAGAVYRPSWAPRLSFAVDYFKINIGNAIGTVQASNSSVQAECENSNGSSPLCALFIRPLPFDNHTPANFPTLAITKALNVATLNTWGIDSEVNYAAPLAGGNLSLRGLLSYQPKNVTVNFQGSPPINQAGAAGVTGQPKYRATAFIHYDNSGVGLDIQQRWHSATKQSGDPTLIYSAPYVPAVAQTDLTLSYTLKRNVGQAQFFLTIQNLFDKEPPFYLPTGARSAIPGFFVPTTNGDDPIGRYFTGGVRYLF